jgi:hypothetical protein
VSVQFVDSTGTPLPSGIVVTISSGGSPVGSAPTDSSGNVAVNVATDTQYLADFGAIADSVAFVGGQTTSELATESGLTLTTESGGAIVVEDDGETTVLAVLSTLRVFPNQASITATGSQQFTAAFVDAGGAASVVEAAWSTDDPHGSVSSSGVYTPGRTSSGNYSVTATYPA